MKNVFHHTNIFVLKHNIMCLFILATCPGLNCQHGGSVHFEDCSCVCPAGYSGFYCHIKEGTRISHNATITCNIYSALFVI